MPSGNGRVQSVDSKLKSVGGNKKQRLKRQGKKAGGQQSPVEERDDKIGPQHKRLLFGYDFWALVQMANLIALGVLPKIIEVDCCWRGVRSVQGEKNQTYFPEWKQVIENINFEKAEQQVALELGAKAAGFVRNKVAIRAEICGSHKEKMKIVLRSRDAPKDGKPMTFTSGF